MHFSTDTCCKQLLFFVIKCVKCRIGLFFDIALCVTIWTSENWCAVLQIITNMYILMDVWDIRIYVMCLDQGWLLDMEAMSAQKYIVKIC